jgi:ribosomal protein S18 acetylase RimI-like enzyme
VSDIREARPALDQIEKANSLGDVPAYDGAMRKPGHWASIDGLVSEIPAAASNMSLLEFASNRPSGQSPITFENKITYPGFDGVNSAWQGANLSGTQDAIGFDLYLLTPADWRVLREARLNALFDSPHAFMSSYADEAGWDESEWRRGFEAARWVVARETEQVIGLARSVVEKGRPSTRHLESIWVAPTHRRRGVFRALLHVIANGERENGATDLLLWVLEDNYTAQLAYQALGFEPTGERQFLPSFGRFERRLRLAVTCLPES